MGDKENPGSQKHPARITVIRREIKKHWERLEEQAREKGKRRNAFQQGDLNKGRQKGRT